ncbi:hypothetical protein RIEPE_0252 [Candidatus Riesia pediculicola USDA]|uniref:Uncharacterized protein n=1 Tax=Riesia pediculicola (strain USDA) TaxID=515618 RepID=D4G849_RIEPU|nr:hypothetical protein RIEPE_0252 [Candidatus Riesia pediculicola USDA]
MIYASFIKKVLREQKVFFKSREMMFTHFLNERGVMLSFINQLEKFKFLFLKNR